MKLALILPLLVLGCVSSVDPRDRVVNDFTPEYPKNYLIVHQGTPADFAKGRCYVLRAEDEDARLNVARYIRGLLRERVPMLPPCRSNEWPRLELSYDAGYGVCIDCGGSKRDPRSAFGGVGLATQPDKYAALAEWQYWRGGTPQLVAQQFVFDVTNLYVNGLEKPIPNVPGRGNAVLH